nr:hypothetical protein [Motilibacter deserti]
MSGPGLALYGRAGPGRVHWPTADQQPGATPATVEYAQRWRDMPKIVLSSTPSAVGHHPALVGGGTPFFLALDNWARLELVKTRAFPDGELLTKYEAKR